MLAGTPRRCDPVGSIRAAIRAEVDNLTEHGRYSEHASPESIGAYLNEAVQASHELQQHIRWLSALHGRRVTEKQHGIWPPGPAAVPRD